jgi:hypothetical protein
MKIVRSENETIIYPILSDTDAETDDDFCIILGNNCTLINSQFVHEDDLPKIIDGLEKALDIINQ